MPVQVTVSDVVDTTSSEVSRRLLIDGRPVAGDQAFASITAAGPEEFLERKTFAGAVLGGDR
ncbi:hypothetical protein MAAFP003_4659 [Mycobacterium ahvazicum]|uniref:Uncharacterized protein n=1 Tax=Mycobacterium ahvazicum TaxID=1964395 RepID=A0A2K4YGS0_9MYCO|nr:hypothetical protein [Mycobacterium ahvazicum]SOX55963.1 hypothetical protein MAAFP003_4659 [Mycobacterium ahvazicum]